MPHPLFQVDAFASEPFTGNPAGVCLLSEAQSDRWMQQVAGEMNLSETAFLLENGDGYNLRWFTPELEVDLCGHATLASAHALWELGRLEPGAEARFHTRSGLLTATQHGAWIELDFPALPAEATAPPPSLAQALGATPTYVGKSKFDLLVEVESEEILRGLQPDFPRLATIPARGCIVTSPTSDAGFDFVSRYFAPAAGINEDPVTGSAHCCLAPYWEKRLGKSTFMAYQASGRGGVLKVRRDGDRVILGGQAVTVLRAELLADAPLTVPNLR